jgi:hypothetical protein
MSFGAHWARSWPAARFSAFSPQACFQSLSRRPLWPIVVLSIARSLPEQRRRPPHSPPWPLRPPWLAVPLHQRDSVPSKKSSYLFSRFNCPNKFERTILRRPLTRLCCRSVNFAHVPVVHAGHLPIVPGDRDCSPTCFSDDAAICGIASPINASALLEAL